MEIEARDQWKLDKWGKFSASEGWKLMVPGPVIDKVSGETAMFGDTANGYIERVARECYTIFNEDENPVSYDMKIGLQNEPESAGYYINYMGIDKFVYYGVANSKFFPYGPHTGVSPDIVLWLDEQNQIASIFAEMKNPKPATHEWNLDNITCGADLAKHYKDYYAQMQIIMLALNCDLGHWCSHNLYFKGKERLLLIEVKADTKFQNSFSLRLKKAIKLKLERIENHKQRLTRLV